MASHSSIVAWEIPWTVESGGLQSLGGKASDTTGHNLEWTSVQPSNRSPFAWFAYSPALLSL